MEKQTPIQKAIAIYEDLSSRMDTRTAGHEQVVGFIKFLKSLLEEEKQFAQDAFEAGEKRITELSSKGRFAKLVDFPDYYKQYTP